MKYKASSLYQQPDMIVRQDEAMLMVLREIWMAVAKEPELRQRFDLVKLFEPTRADGWDQKPRGLRERDACCRRPDTDSWYAVIRNARHGQRWNSARQPTPQGPVTPKVMPDEQVMRELSRAGNLVPMG